MAPRQRVLTFGSAAALVVAGSIFAALVGGLTGEVLAIGLIALAPWGSRAPDLPGGEAPPR